MISARPHLAHVHRSREGGQSRVSAIRLDLNERVPPFPDDTFRRITAALEPRDVCSYPDVLPLTEDLSARLGISADQIYLTNGSDSAIRMLFRAFVAPGDAVVMPRPTYAMYPIHAALSQAEIRQIPYAADFTLSVDDIVRHLERRPKLVALAVPDQPSGAVLSPAEIERIVRVAADHDVLVLVDEAYHPFYSESALPFLARHRNLAITRSFSKAFGLAGLRLGAVFADPVVIESLRRVRGAFEVNGAALAMARYVLKNGDIVESYVRDVEAGRALVLTAARELGLGAPPCPTNFQLVRCSGVEEALALVSGLREEGYLVKGPLDAPFESAVRITIGAPSVMAPFTDALRRVAAAGALRQRVADRSR